MDTDQNQELENKEEIDLQERQFSDDEVKAMDHGWVPKDKWRGNPDEWVPANVFNMKGDFFKRIAQDKATINELKESINGLVEHNKKLFDAGYKKAVGDLKRQKQEALEVGDTKAVMEIDDQLEEMREQHQQGKEEFEKKVNPQSGRTNVDFEAWHAQNGWYQQDLALTGYADSIGQELVKAANSAGKGIEWSKLYNEVTRKVRQKFPEKFETRTRETMTREEVGNGDNGPSEKTSQSNRGLREADLTEDQRRIMNNILKTTKGMTKKDYLDQMSLFEERKGVR